LLPFDPEPSVLSSAIEKRKFRIYTIIISAEVLYGIETWSVTLRVEYRLTVFEDRLLRRMFRQKRDEMTRE
jgi:hypothetical protein